MNGDTGVSKVQDAIVTPVKTSGMTNLLQIQTVQVGSVISCSTIPCDNTIPQSSEGTEVMTLTITPLSATSTLEIVVAANGNEVANTADAFCVALFKDSAADALAVSGGSMPATASPSFASAEFTHYITSGSTSPITFKVRCGANSGTFAFNGTFGGGALFGGVFASRITVKEYQA